LPDGLSEIFLSEGLDSPNQLEAPRQIAVLAHAMSMDMRGGKPGVAQNDRLNAFGQMRPRERTPLVDWRETPADPVALCPHSADRRRWRATVLMPENDPMRTSVDLDQRE
jgi:hypothetical protein